VKISPGNSPKPAIPHLWPAIPHPTSVIPHPKLDLIVIFQILACPRKGKYEYRKRAALVLAVDKTVIWSILGVDMC